MVPDLSTAYLTAVNFVVSDSPVSRPGVLPGDFNSGSRGPYIYAAPVYGSVRADGITGFGFSQNGGSSGS